MHTHPARMVALGFALAVVTGTTVLALPISRAGDGSAPLLTALFTATSAVCVTGLTVVDTGTYWSGFGEAVILFLIQAGGFGIMALASLLALLVVGRLRLMTLLHAQAESKFGMGEVRGVLKRVALVTVAVEAVTAAVLTARFHFGHGQPLREALGYGVFHAVSAFNNAGFGLYADSLTGYAHDPWVLLPVAGAVILGGLGFPVLLELLRHWRANRAARRATAGPAGPSGVPRGWSLHLRLTLWLSAALLAAGTALTLLLEWSNRGTLGPLSGGDKLLGAFFHSAMLRTAGFNATDIAAMEPATLLSSSALMFIGGGSAGTAGGIKVTTFAVLGVAILAEVRGESAAGVFGRRLSPAVLRQALTVALLGVAAVLAASIALLATVDARADVVLFEAASAFGTVGLTAGLTGELPGPAQLILIALMFLGRVGPITLASALALRERKRRYQLPEERPIIG
ncbi:TrkH family potassium uptake protein [Streptomyces sp. NPDC059853]|uniref:TrkH family potassium uptake protein n=1 Tax=Streptomyces sp. NPDC059853 TaxID=3346973 RepID=UPI003654FA29